MRPIKDTNQDSGNCPWSAGKLGNTIPKPKANKISIKIFFELWNFLSQSLLQCFIGRETFWKDVSGFFLIWNKNEYTKSRTGLPKYFWKESCSFKALKKYNIESCYMALVCTLVDSYMSLGKRWSFKRLFRQP